MYVINGWFFSPDGGRAYPLRGHGDQPAVRHDAGARKTAAAAPRQNVGDAKGVAPRARPVAAGAAHQQGLVDGRDRRDTEVGLRHRVRRRVHSGHGEVPGTVRRPVQHTIRENQLRPCKTPRTLHV